jgi:hypothetical protein
MGSNLVNSEDSVAIVGYATGCGEFPGNRGQFRTLPARRPNLLKRIFDGKLRWLPHSSRSLPAPACRGGLSGIMGPDLPLPVLQRALKEIKIPQTGYSDPWRG